jgi:HEAT repeat protein
MVQSENTEKHKEAVGQLKTNFVSLPNKDQAWQDLICLTQDDDSDVRERAAYALGSAFISIPDTHKDQAWQDLIRLIQDGNSNVRWGAAAALGSAFISIPDGSKDQAWQDLIRLTQDGNSNVRWRAASVLGSAFFSIPDGSKDQAWQDLIRLIQDGNSFVRSRAADALGSAFRSIPDAHKDQARQDLIRLTQDDDSDVRRRAADALGSAFISIPAAHKDQAWQDLIRLTQDDDSDVRWGAAAALGSAFFSIPDGSKDQAWQNLHNLTQDGNSNVRWGAAAALGSAFISIPDGSKDQAWQDLHNLTQDNNSNVRWGAAAALGSAFRSIPDDSKDQAWQDLIRLTQDDYSNVRWGVADALGSAFISIPDGSKDQAWQDLHNLTQDDDSNLRWGVADTLDSAFFSIPDGSKDQAWQDLIRLTQDGNSNVRWGAADALGSAFISIPDGSKDQAWQDLHRLIQDDDRQVRVLANYSLGRVSILIATKAVNENEFKNELKNALEFFEKSNIEATFINPARFCHPFYKSIFSITFEERNVEAEVQEYIKEAKNAIEGSESKKTLLEVVKNLENALREVHKSREKGLDAWKSDLKAYKRYCDRACDLLDSTKENAPGATKIIRRGMPIIDKRIIEIIADIQENTRVACQESRCTPTEEIVCTTNQIVQKWEISDQDQMTENIEDLISTLKSKIPYIPQNEQIYNRIEKIRNESDLMNQYKKVEVLIALIPTATVGEIYMGDYFNNIQNATIINKSIVEKSFNKVKKEYNEEVAKSLIQIAEFIEESDDISAGILFDNFNEELNKPQPDKSKIKKIWNGIEKTLPSIKIISEVIVKLAPLF